VSNDYLSILSFLPTVFWIVVLLVAGMYLKHKDEEKRLSPYYLINLNTKLFFSLSFAFVYLLYYGGGDTTAYFDGAISMNNLFVKSPELYFEQLFNEPDYVNYWSTFDSETGYPPGWIYRESEAFFICKILSLFSFLSFKSYLALTVMVSFLAATASWKLYVFVKKYQLTSDRNLAIAFLFIPSVNFWCAGISKDTFVYIGICYILLFAFKIIEPGKKSLKTYLLLFLFCWLMFHIRPFMLYVIALPFTLVLVARLVRKLGGKDITVKFVRTLIMLVGFGVITYVLSSQSEDQLLQSNALLQEAAVTQGDFATNETYGTNRYSIGEVEFTFLGLLRTAPSAIFAGMLRPTINEALQPSLFLNGLESVCIIFIFLRFISKKPIAKYRYIRAHEFLGFCLIFILLLGFTTGLTSGLFGVLVRLRAPLLPFLMLLLFVDYSSVLKRKNQQSELETS